MPIAHINNLTFRTGSAWVNFESRKPGFAIDLAAEDIIDAPAWIPTGSIKNVELGDIIIVEGEKSRPGVWA